MATIYGKRWEVLKSLSEGGQAHTFIVTDLNGTKDSRYVLKRLKNLDRLDRFKGEIEAVKNLSHEYIVKLVNFDLEAKKPYLVTEYCEGGSLSEAEPIWLKSPVIAFKIFQQICEGVAHAHTNHIIHRDLRPDNIFLCTREGPAVVGDFGICYLEQSGERITLTDEALGPRNFMAPELEDGKLNLISDKSDVYSFGKILYWLLSGGKIFSREKHREPQFDLKGKNDDTLLGWNNIYMEHVNRLLDYMIVTEPVSRRDVENIKILSRQTMRLLMEKFTPIDKDIKQPCAYCGQGYYVLRAVKTHGVDQFGVTPVSPCDWRILSCNKCGHVQSFRIDMAEKKEWWNV